MVGEVVGDRGEVKGVLPRSAVRRLNENSHSEDPDDLCFYEAKVH